MVFRRIVGWYEKYERLVSSVSLVGGFVFDAIFLKRVDLFIENFWIVVHLSMAAVGIIGLNIVEKRRTQSAEGQQSKSRWHFWLIIWTQFAFGGLLAAFLVFYFRSTTFLVNWPFIFILAVAFAANEIFKKHYVRLSFQISLFFLSVYAFAIFLVPILMHRIGADVFVISGAASLFVLGLFLAGLRFIARERFVQSRKILWFSIAGIVLVVNFLYFANLIPPIPISLKDAGIYHSVLKNSAGGYTATEENQTWLGIFKQYEDFNDFSNAPVYAYTAIFSPTNFGVSVIHDWQYYDETKKQWISVSKIRLPIVGGRDGGYRTYSKKSGIFPGLWRVDVKTIGGQLIGRLKFNVIESSAQPALSEVRLE